MATIRKITILLAAALAAASGLLGTGAASAASAGGISLRPGHVDNNDPATRAYFKPVVAAGASYSDFVAVTNVGDGPLDVFVSGVDGVTGVTSGAVYANRQDPVTRAGGWVHVTTDRFSLPPHGSRDIPFTVQVPADATPGDHLAGIAFENADPQKSSGDFAITQVIRAVIGVQVRVPGVTATHEHIDKVGIVSAPGLGTASVIVTLGNDGQLLDKPTLAVTLDGPSAYHQVVTRVLDTVLPGDTIPFPLAWPDTLATGEYSVSALLTGAGGAVPFKTTVRLGTAVKGAAPTATPPPPPDTKSATPLWLVLLAAFLLGGVLIAVVLIAGIGIGRRADRRRQMTTPPPDASPYDRQPEPVGSQPHV